MPKFNVSVECHTPGRDEIHWLKLEAADEGDANEDGDVLSINNNHGDGFITNWPWNLVAAFPKNLTVWMPIPEKPH